MTHRYKKMKNLEKLITTSLYEREDDTTEDEYFDDEESEKNIEKSDIKDKDESDNKDAVLSIKLNGNIKLLTIEEVSDIFDISSVLSLYNINDVTNIPKDFIKNKKIEIMIKSPLSEFSNHTYIIKMLKGLGQLEVHRDELHQTYTSKEPINMQKAVEQQVSDTEVTDYVDFDASKYYDQLNNYFISSVKKEFIDRIIAKYV